MKEPLSSILFIFSVVVISGIIGKAGLTYNTIGYWAVIFLIGIIYLVGALKKR